MRSKSLTVSVGFAALVAAFAVPAHAALIPVISPGFENPGTDFGDYWGTHDANWAAGAGTGHYEQNKGDNSTAVEGIWSVFLPNVGSLSQNLGTTVNAGDILSVSFYIGNGFVSNIPPSGSQTGGGGILTADFKVGGTDYTGTFSSVNVTQSDNWIPYTFTQTIANTGNLSLSFINTSGNVWLDDISANVTETPVPEPTALALLTLGAMALLAGKKRV